MLRKLALMMALSPAIWVSTVFALGLGEINVTSGLNQRFSATIPLNDLGPDEAETLQVGLAQNEAFTRAGIERSDYLSTLAFTVITDDGRPRITISSRQIAREPYLGLLVDVRSRNSHVLRQYSVLLDPPDYGLTQESRPVPVEPSAPVATEPQKPTKTTAVSKAHSDVEPAPAQTSSYGPIAVGETLWSVATHLRPAADVTMDQAQLALYTANPDAFEDNRIDKLLKGATLKVPSKKAMTAVSATTAKIRVQQLRAANVVTPPRPAKKEPPVTKAPEALTAEPVVTVPAESPKPEAAPVPTTKAPAAAASAPKPAPAAPVAPEVKAPVVTAPPPLAESPASAVAAGAPVTNALPLLEDSSAVTTTTEGEAASGTSVEAASPAEAQPVEPVKPYIPPPIPPSPEPTPLMEEWQEPMMLIGGVASIVGLLGWLYLSRKRKPATPKIVPTATPKKPFDWQFWKKKQDTDVAALAKTKSSKLAPKSTPMAVPESAFDEEQFEREYEATQRTSNAGAPTESQRVDLTQDETAQLPNFDSTQMFETPPGGSSLPTTTAESDNFDITGRFEAETLKIDLNSNDPLAEADFHLAYGLYDEAALQLKQAAQKLPDRVDIPTKLAEVYFRAGKTIDFMEVAEGLKVRLSPAEWSKVALMGKQLNPEAPLFQGVDTSALAAEVDMAFDEPTTPMAAPAKRAVPAAAKAKADAPLEFDLSSFETPKVEQEKPHVPDADNSLDFKLEDFDLEVPAVAPAKPKAEPSSAAKTKVDAPLEFDLSAFDLGDEIPTAVDQSTTGNDDFKIEDFDLGAPDDSNEISTGDEASTKLDLARAYVDMGDNEMARSLLNEVLQQGSAIQKTEAQTLLGRLT